MTNGRQVFRAEVELQQTAVPAAKTPITPTLLPCVIGPAFEVMDVYSADGTLNTLSKYQYAQYAQMPMELLQTKFPVGTKGTDRAKMNVLEETIRLFHTKDTSIVEKAIGPGSAAIGFAHWATGAGISSGVIAGSPGAITIPAGGTLVLNVDDPSMSGDDVTLTLVAGVYGQTALMQHINDLWLAAKQVGILCAASGTTKLTLSSPSFGANSTIVLRATSTLSLALALGAGTSDLYVVGSGFTGLADGTGNPTTPWVQYYRGDQTATGAPWGGTAKAVWEDLDSVFSDSQPLTRYFTGSAKPFEIKVGDYMHATGSSGTNTYTVKEVRKDYLIFGNLVGTTWSTTKVGHRLSSNPFAPKKVWFQGNDLLSTDSNTAYAVHLDRAALAAVAAKATAPIGSPHAGGTYPLAAKTIVFQHVIAGVEQAAETFTFAADTANIATAIIDFQATYGATAGTDASFTTGAPTSYTFTYVPAAVNVTIDTITVAVASAAIATLVAAMQKAWYGILDVSYSGTDITLTYLHKGEADKITFADNWIAIGATALTAAANLNLYGDTFMQITSGTNVGSDYYTRVLTSGTANTALGYSTVAIAYDTGEDAVFDGTPASMYFPSNLTSFGAGEGANLNRFAIIDFTADEGSTWTGYSAAWDNSPGDVPLSWDVVSLEAFLSTNTNWMQSLTFTYSDATKTVTILHIAATTSAVITAGDTITVALATLKAAFEDVPIQLVSFQQVGATQIRMEFAHKLTTSLTFGGDWDVIGATTLTNGTVITAGTNTLPSTYEITTTFEPHEVYASKTYIKIAIAMASDSYGTNQLMIRPPVGGNVFDGSQATISGDVVASSTVDGGPTGTIAAGFTGPSKLKDTTLDFGFDYAPTSEFGLTFGSDSLDDAIDDINALVGATVAYKGQDAPVGTGTTDGLTVQSPLKGVVSYLDVGILSTSIPVLASSGAVFVTGTGRTSPDAYLDDEGDIRISAHIIRNAVTGYPLPGSIVDLYVQYEALRQDVFPTSSWSARVTDEDYSDYFYANTSDPLGLAVYFGTLNAPGQDYLTIGVDEVSAAYPMGTPEAYARAAVIAKRYKPWATTILTTDAAILAAMKVWMTGRVATKKDDCIVIGSVEKPTRYPDSIAANGDDGDTHDTATNTFIVEADPASALIALGIDPTSDIPYDTDLYLKLAVSSAVRYYKVLRLSGTTITVVTNWAPLGWPSTFNADGFYTTTDLTTALVSADWTLGLRGDSLTDSNGRYNTTGASEALNTYTNAFADRRVWMVYADTVIASLSAGSVALEPYYYAAGLGGARCYQHPAQNFDDFVVAGFTGVTGTDDTFDPESELPVIAGGGNIIPIQESLGSSPIIWKQVTTDTSEIKFQAQNITTALDYFSAMYRASVRGAIRGHNITASDLRSANLTAQAVCKKAVSDGVLLACDPGIITADTTQLDETSSTVAATVIYPWNKQKVTVLF